MTQMAFCFCEYCLKIMKLEVSNYVFAHILWSQSSFEHPSGDYFGDQHSTNPIQCNK